MRLVKWVSERLRAVLASFVKLMATNLGKIIRQPHWTEIVVGTSR